jgi:hypothetical protein
VEILLRDWLEWNSFPKEDLLDVFLVKLCFGEVLDSLSSVGDSLCSLGSWHEES